jgi:hypothetical protein
LIPGESLYKEIESLYEKIGKIIAITGYLPGVPILEEDWSCCGKISNNWKKGKIWQEHYQYGFFENKTFWH